MTKKKIKKERPMACPSGKNTYETEDDVKREVRASFLFKNVKLSHYFCMQCFKYHLTSRLNKKK